MVISAQMYKNLRVRDVLSVIVLSNLDENYHEHLVTLVLEDFLIKLEDL